MCSQAMIRKCSGWHSREEKNTFTSFKIFFSWQKSIGNALPLQEKHDLGAASSNDAAPPAPSQLMSWGSTGRWGEVREPVQPSSAPNHTDNMTTRDVWILAHYSSVLLGFWHESKSLAGSMSIKSLTRLKLKVSGWKLRDEEARVGERSIQTSMAGSAEYVHCNPQRGVVCAPVMVHTIIIKRSWFFHLPPTTGYCNSKRKHKYPGIWHTLENGQVRETEHSREADMEVTFFFCIASPHQPAQLGQ